MRRTFGVLSIILATAGVEAAPARAAAVGLLVPAYFYPGTGGPGGAGDGWAAMTAAAAEVAITAILNPDSGPRAGAANPSYASAMTSLEAAGGRTIAYLSTDYGAVPLGTVESEIETYVGQYGRLIDGFFVDAMSNASAELPYYQSLATFIRNLSPSYTIIGNPGTATRPSYLGSSPPVANAFGTFEGDAASYPKSPPPGWVTGFPASDFANIVYQQGSASGMEGDIALAVQRNVGLIYVTDRGLPNPFDQLPSYWSQEVAAIAATAVPEPRTTILLATGLLAAMAAARATRRTAVLARPR